MGFNWSPLYDEDEELDDVKVSTIIYYGSHGLRCIKTKKAFMFNVRRLIKVGYSREQSVKIAKTMLERY